MRELHAVELLFDPATEAALTERLGALEPPSPLLGWGARPHVSLLVGAARPGLRAGIEWLARQSAPTPVRLDAVGVFPGDAGVVFLAPVVTPALLALHEAAHEALAPALADPDPLYAPGRWVPHCTTTVGIPDAGLGAAVAACRSWLPVEGRLSSIALHAITLDPDAPGWARVAGARYAGEWALAGG